MDLLRDVKRKQLKIKITIILAIIVLIVTAVLVFLHVKENKENDLINQYILNANRNATLIFDNDLSKIKLYKATLENIKKQR